MTETLDLQHQHPDCTGQWRRDPGSGGSRPWRCSGCGAVYYHCPEVVQAVVREREVEELLRELAEPKPE